MFVKTGGIIIDIVFFIIIINFKYLRIFYMTIFSNNSISHKDAKSFIKKLDIPPLFIAQKVEDIVKLSQ